MVGHILLFFRSPDNELLRSFSVELVLRLGLNSHSLNPEGFPSAAQFAFRLAGDPEHATIVSSAALLSLPALLLLVPVCFRGGWC